MIGAELLNQIDARLKQITGNFDENFGGLDIIYVRDLWQLRQSVQLQSICSQNNGWLDSYFGED